MFAICLAFASIEADIIPLLLQTEDRAVMKERVSRVREHHPVEKEFVVSVMYLHIICLD